MEVWLHTLPSLPLVPEATSSLNVAEQLGRCSSDPAPPAHPARWPCEPGQQPGLLALHNAGTALH